MTLILKIPTKIHKTNKKVYLGFALIENFSPFLLSHFLLQLSHLSGIPLQSPPKSGGKQDPEVNPDIRNVVSIFTLQPPLFLQS